MSRFENILLLFVILETYHYNFTCLQNIPLLTPSTHLFEFLDQIARFFLLAPSLFYELDTALHGRGHAAPHLARVRRLRITLLADPPLHQRRHGSPAPPTAHRFTTMAHPRHAGTSAYPWTARSNSSLRQAAQSLERFSNGLSPAPSLQRGQSFQQQARERSSRIHGCAGREAGARAAVVQPEHLWAHRGALSASSTTLLWPRHGRRR